MTSFQKMMRVGEAMIEFSFTQVITTQGTKYTVKTLTNRQHFTFDMVMKKGKWVIVESPKPPKWISAVEEELANTIFDNYIID